MLDSSEATNLESNIEEEAKVESIEFSEELKFEMDDMTFEPDSYLETFTDHVRPEAIWNGFSHMINNFMTGEGTFGDAWQTYLDSVEESTTERHEAKLEEALEDDSPVFTASKVQELIEEAKAEAREEARQELKEATVEAYQDGLNDGIEMATEELAPEPVPEGEPAVEPVDPVGTEYTVVSGDSLWKIAERAYGDGSQWTTIYEANQDIIGDNPNIIHPGQEFVIPEPSELVLANTVITPPTTGEAAVPTPPEETPQTEVGPEANEAITQNIEALKHDVDGLIADRDGIVERNVADPAIDGRRIALAERMEQLDRAVMRDLTPENYEQLNNEYEQVYQEYQEVSAALFEEHVRIIPLQFAEKATLDRLQYDNTLVERAMEQGDWDKVGELLDNAWRDYDDGKMAYEIPSHDDYYQHVYVDDTPQHGSEDIHKQDHESPGPNPGPGPPPPPPPPPVPS